MVAERLSAARRKHGERSAVAEQRVDRLLLPWAKAVEAEAGLEKRERLFDNPKSISPGRLEESSGTRYLRIARKGFRKLPRPGPAEYLGEVVLGERNSRPEGQTEFPSHVQVLGGPPP